IDPDDVILPPPAAAARGLRGTMAFLRGSLAPDGASGYIMAFSSNRAGSLDPYVRGLTPGGPPSASYAQVSGDGTYSGGAQIAPTPGGHVVVWRSEDSLGRTGTLLAAAITGISLTVGPPVVVSPAAVDVGAFALVADGANVAVAYQSLDVPFSEAAVVRLNPDASVSGGSIALTVSGTLSESIGAALRGSNLAVLWVDNRFEASLHARTVDLTTGALGAQVDLSMAGFALADVSLSLDGTSDYVAAFRDGSSGGSVAMLRLDSTLHIRDGVSTVGAAAPSGEVVRIASNGAGLYAVGWSDEAVASGHGSVQLMTCP
ncbi:MAG: hypothetical protein WCJ30_18595, partial [Deltaproteobacteria bacterium]